MPMRGSFQLETSLSCLSYLQIFRTFIPEPLTLRPSSPCSELNRKGGRAEGSGCHGDAVLCLCGTLTSSCSQYVTSVRAAAAIAPGFTPNDSENTAIAKGNTHSAKVKRTRRRDLTINVLQDAASEKGNDGSSSHWVTSDVESSADEDGHVISI